MESESKDYEACKYMLDNLAIIARTSKITPKKVGQFVTFWKRSVIGGEIEPFSATDRFDFFVINIRFADKIGQFVFPKLLLIAMGVISSEEKEGKRGFRVYAPWDITTSKQAQRTQKWQVEYFYEIPSECMFERATKLYGAG